MEHIDNFVKFLERYVQPKGAKIFTVLGFLYFAAKSFEALGFLRRLIPQFGYDLADRYGEGSWVLVTGGSQDIGKAFASELASKGFNIILVDNSSPALESTGHSIQQKFPAIQVKTIGVDFADSFREGFYDALSQQIGELDISILVNALGTSEPFGVFHWANETQIMNSLIQNTVPMTVLSRRLIPSLLLRSKKSAVINLTSAVGLHPTKNLGMYSATKGYADFLTRIIYEEAGPRLDVISVRPWMVTSVVSQERVWKVFRITPERLVQETLKRLGKTSHTYGTWIQEIQAGLGINGVIRSAFVRRLYSSEQKLQIAREENII